jgi:hypothetical protein
MGVPDRYVCGGRWIEFKQAAVVNKISPLRLFSSSQITMLDKLTKYGDECYACILFQFQDSSWCLFIEWTKLKEFGTWDRALIEQHAWQEGEDWEEMVKEALLYD